MSALLLCALVAIAAEAQLVVAGKVGCTYDYTVCDKVEVCIDDSLFGVCVIEELAGDATVAELNQRIIEGLIDDESRLRELQLLIAYLGRAGYTWQSPFVQCVVEAFRVSIVTRTDTTDYGSCVGVQQSADGQLQSQSPMFDLQELRANDEEPFEADKRDEQVSVHKYFKKLDSNGARRDEFEHRVNEILLMNDDQLRRRIAELRTEVAASLYDDQLQRVADSDFDSGSDGADDDERTRMLLSSAVDKMKERVLAQLQRIDTDSGLPKRLELRAERDSVEDSASSDSPVADDTTISIGESSMRSATPSASEINVDKKDEPVSTETAKQLALSDTRNSDGFLTIDERYGVVKLAEGFSSYMAAESAFVEIVNAVKWPTSCLQFLDVEGMSNNALRFRVRDERECDGILVAEFLNDLWKNREMIKTETSYNVMAVIIGKDTLRVMNAVAPDNEADSNSELLVTVIVCAVVLCVVLLAVIIFIICTMVRRRRARSDLDKSLLLTGSDAPETYGELCRQRMTQSANEKLEAIPVPVRSLFGRSKIFAARTSPPATKTSPDRSQVNSTSSANAWMDEPLQTNMDITTGHAILSYMEAFLRNPEKLELEWQGLSEYEADRKATTIGQRDENHCKNHHQSMLPYDHNRVVLTNYLGGDYINASFIADHDPRSPAYIATQSPLAETVNDFWQLVWEHGGNILVDLVSSGARGADGNNNAAAQGSVDVDYRYWPTEGMETFGSLEVHLVSEHLVCDDYVVRNFYLKNAVTNETRTISQFHYLSWTEHGVPSIRSLLEFRRKVIKSHHHGKSKPIVVHCSDGCGRTGTYCLIDLVLNRITKGTVKEVDVGATIEHLRDQRVSMVKTKKQFEFALMAIADEVNAVLKALAAQQTKS